eukprot:7482093-Pyramimonas_sp.AAC.1
MIPIGIETLARGPWVSFVFSWGCWDHVAELQSMVRACLTRLGVTLSEQASAIMSPVEDSGPEEADAAISKIRKD